MKRIATITGLLILTITALATGRDFWEFPDSATLPDNGRLLLHDPAIPAGDADRRTRNITGAALKSAVRPTFQNAQGVNLPQRDVFRCDFGLTCDDAEEKTRLRVNRNLDGGAAASVYLSDQSVDAGGAQ